MESKGTELELYFVLAGAPDESALSHQKELREVNRSVRSQSAEVWARSYAFDAIGGGGGLSGEYGVLLSAVGPALCGVLGTALGNYLGGRAGRKVRLRVGLDGTIEAEAQTPEELEKILDLAQKIKDRNQAKVIHEP
jgi:hypothetical protein